MNLQRILNGIKARLLRLSDKPYEWRLMNSKPSQKETFENLQGHFVKTAQRLSGEDLGDFVSPLWKEMNLSFLDAIKEGIPFTFLRHSLIGYTMFTQKGGKLMKSQLEILKKTFPVSVLQTVLEEDPTGAPLIMEHSFRTSHNSIHLLSHVARWQAASGGSLSEMKTIVEWGGGYGRLAALLDRLKSGKPYTYVIVDTPLFSAIQALYLSTVLGSEKVHFLENAEKEIVMGKINIVPLNFIKKCDNIKADLFISTWALSESSLFAQNFVSERSLFGANHILIAFQDKNIRLPDAEGVKDIMKKFGGTLEDIPFLSGNHYIFK